MTDAVPGDLGYVTTSLTATAGHVGDDAAPVLTWTGALSEASVITITYVVTVTTSAPKAISNTAIIVAPGYQTITSTVTIIANGRVAYLPVVLRSYASQ